MFDFDAVVIGSGPAGSTLARSLAKKGLRVMLTDKETSGKGKVCGGFLGPEVFPLMQTLGLADAMNGLGANRIEHVIVSGPKTPLFETKFSHGYGMAVDRGRFDAFLVQKAQEAGVVAQAPVHLRSYRRENGYLKLTLQNGGPTFSVDSRYLIFATGRRSYKNAGRDSRGSIFYSCKATYQNVSFLENRVALHFVTKAHVGLNPLGGRKATLCLYADEAHLKAAKGNMDLMMERFMRENSNLRRNLSEAVRVTPWQSCQAEPDSEKIYYRRGAFYAGDAVAMANPIIGGGIPIAINSSLILSELLTRAIHDKVGDNEVASNYEKIWKKILWRKFRLGKYLGMAERSRFLSQALFRTMSLFRGMYPMLVNLSRQGVVKQHGIREGKI